MLQAEQVELDRQELQVILVELVELALVVLVVLDKQVELVVLVA